MSTQPQHTLRHNLKHCALHVHPLLTLCIGSFHMLDQFKEEMMQKVPQNVFE